MYKTVEGEKIVWVQNVKSFSLNTWERWWYWWVRRKIDWSSWFDRWVSSRVEVNRTGCRGFFSYNFSVLNPSYLWSNFKGTSVYRATSLIHNRTLVWSRWMLFRYLLAKTIILNCYVSYKINFNEGYFPNWPHFEIKNSDIFSYCYLYMVCLGLFKCRVT